jgi:hypothetical protein
MVGQRIWAVIEKEFIQTLRDRSTLWKRPSSR